jgi:rhomboid family GlyGly-CTERM serine protease
VYVRPDWTAWRPGLTLLALCLLPLLLPETATNWLEFRRDAVLAGEVWRLWSGHLVHFSASHAALDGLTCFLLAYALRRAGERRALLPRLALIAPAISLLLLIVAPDMTFYRGASALAMALAVATGLAIWRARPAWRGLLVVSALALALKVALDALHVPLLPASPTFSTRPPH